MQNIYDLRIAQKYNALKQSGKQKFDNYDLAKIFEWFSCIKISNIHKKQFYVYEDIDPSYKEDNQLSQSDTGIDLCDVCDTIVQCKLREKYLGWKECGTFFGSQNIYENNKIVVRWPNLIISRNTESTMSQNLLLRQKMFTDITFETREIVDYCEKLHNDKVFNNEKLKVKIKLRDYQNECINLINNTQNNVIICLPTGTGKNIVITRSLNTDQKYLILVPRIILMDQLKTELLLFNPEWKNKIQTIGDGKNIFDDDYNITICVFNSVHLITDFEIFNKIFIDEAHHINIPEIYTDLTHDEKQIGYLESIRQLSKYKNNIYLSATIDEIEDFTYYKKDIREMIDNKYLCDYTIHIPIFSDDPSDINICKYLIEHHMNIIVYCNTQSHGIKINDILNNLLEGSSAYIDCTIKRTARNKILNEYKSGNLLFLVNVRVLVEGFDAPITKGVCFLHMPKSSTTVIQIIGRALRLHKEKIYAKIILPFCTSTDGSNINHFLSTIAISDSKIMKSYTSKKLGGYINLAIVDQNDNTLSNDVEFKYDIIYNNLGVQLNGVDIFKKQLQCVAEYIDEFLKKPSECSKIKKEKQMAEWLRNNQKKYKKLLYCMKNDTVRQLWENFINSDKYSKYFDNNITLWIEMLQKIVSYINTYNKKPSQNSENENEKKMGMWLASQIKDYKNIEKIMKNEKIRTEWSTFINSKKYKIYFTYKICPWKETLEKIKTYIALNKVQPTERSKIKEEKQMGTWIRNQKRKYKNYIGSMNDAENRHDWENFVSEYL